MREPGAETRPFALIAEFETPDRLAAAIRSAREGGYRCLDACSPLPIDGVAEALDFHPHGVAWLTLAGGTIGAALGFGLQAYTRIDYPIDVGGRPLFAYQAFLLVAFLTAVLFAALFGIGGMLALNHLPRLHHPLFGVEAFGLADPDRFYLVVFANDPKFDPEATRAFLDRLAPRRVALAGHAEAPQ